jgi:hypothetical protein
MNSSNARTFRGIEQARIESNFARVYSSVANVMNPWAKVAKSVATIMHTYVSVSLPNHFMPHSRITIWLGATAAITALSVQEYFARHWGGGPLGFSPMALAQGISASLWAVLIPTVIAPLAHKFPLEPGRLGSNLLRHAAFGAALSVIHLLGVACLFAMRFYGWSPAAARDVFRDRMHTAYALDVLVYLLIVGCLTLRRLRQQEASDAALSNGPTPPTPPSGTGVEYLQRILVKNDGRIGVVPVQQLAWLEAADNDVVVHTDSGNHTVRSTLARFAERLDPKKFVRVHRSAIVNVERVREVQPLFHGELVLLLKDNTRLTIGRTYRDMFLSVLEG